MACGSLVFATASVALPVTGWAFEALHIYTLGHSRDQDAHPRGLGSVLEAHDHELNAQSTFAPLEIARETPCFRHPTQHQLPAVARLRLLGTTRRSLFRPRGSSASSVCFTACCRHLAACAGQGPQRFRHRQLYRTKQASHHRVDCTFPAAHTRPSKKSPRRQPCRVTATSAPLPFTLRVAAFGQSFHQQ